MGEPIPHFPHGILQFVDREVPVPFTEKRREKLLAVLAEMRGLDDAGDMHRDHEHAGKCRTCGVRGGRGVTQVEVPALAVPVWMMLSI